MQTTLRSNIATNVAVFFPFSQQCGQPPPAEPDDSSQPGRGVRTHSAAAARGNCGRHNGHQVPEHCSGNPHRAQREGVCQHYGR